METTLCRGRKPGDPWDDHWDQRSGLGVKTHHDFGDTAVEVVSVHRGQRAGTGLNHVDLS